MATARCYTKSGNVEKYESNCFSGVVNYHPNNFVHHIIGPNSNGNYTITYEGYDDGNSSNYDCYCKTIYGPDWRNGKGEIKTFYFKKSISIIKYVISIINGPSYNYDDSQYVSNENEERGTIYISDYKCIKVVAYYSDNTSKALSFDDSDNPGFNIYISYKYYKYEYNINTKNYDTIEDTTLYEHLSSTQETYIGDTKTEREIFYRGDEEEINMDEGDNYQFFKIIDGITQINGIPVEH